MRAGYSGVLVGSLLLPTVLSFGTLVAQTQSMRGNAVDGIVVDKGKSPVPSAEVELKRQGAESRVTRSGNDGHFSFPGVQTGSVALTVRRMGYTARTVNMDVPAAGVAATIEIELEEIPSDIASVIVESSKQHLGEFYQRKANNNFAKFFDSKDIERRNPFYLSEMVGTVSGANISSKGAGFCSVVASPWFGWMACARPVPNWTRWQGPAISPAWKCIRLMRASLPNTRTGTTGCAERSWSGPRISRADARSPRFPEGFLFDLNVR
jgi:hypothetical protein